MKCRINGMVCFYYSRYKSPGYLTELKWPDDRYVDDHGSLMFVCQLVFSVNPKHHSFDSFRYSLWLWSDTSGASSCTLSNVKQSRSLTGSIDLQKGLHFNNEFVIVLLSRHQTSWCAQDVTYLPLTGKSGNGSKKVPLNYLQVMIDYVQ